MRSHPLSSNALWIPTMLCLALAGGCTCSPGGSPPPRRTAESEGPTFTDVAGGITWRPSEPFVSRRVEPGGMRAAEYGVRDRADTELAVFFFEGEGGDVQENIDRWVDQFAQEGGGSSRDAAQIERSESGAYPVTRVDVSGTFRGMRGAGAASETPGYRMLGAIVEGPRGLVFFKLLGPAEHVEFASAGFDEMLRSVEPTD